MNMTATMYYSAPASDSLYPGAPCGPQPGHRYRFDGFTLDTRTRVLMNLEGEPASLTAKSFDALVYLVEHAGKLVTKSELTAALWPTTVVGDNNLYVAISHLRQALRATSGGNSPITTISGRGYQFTAAVERVSDPTEQNSQVHAEDAVPTVRTGTGARSGLSSALARLCVVGAMLLVIAWVAGTESGNTPTMPLGPVGGQVSMAVLPFRNLTGDKSRDFIGESIADELITQLSRINELRVSPRTASFTYDAERVKLSDIARRLQVDFLVEGSVRMVGERIRVNVQLINAASDAFLWSETYDREFTDILDLQDKLSAVIMSALVRERMVLSMAGAEKIFNQALTDDPNFVPARVGLALAYANQSLDQPQLSDLAEREANTVLRTDPQNSAALAVLGRIRFLQGRYVDAQEYFDTALAIEGDDEFVRQEYVPLLIGTGRLRDAIRMLEEIREQRRLSPYALGFLAETYAELGREDLSRRYAAQADRYAVPHALYPIASALRAQGAGIENDGTLDAGWFLGPHLKQSVFSEAGHLIVDALHNRSTTSQVASAKDRLLSKSQRLESYAMEQACQSLVYLYSRLGDLDSAYAVAQYCVDQRVGDIPSGVGLSRLWSQEMAGFRADSRFSDYVISLKINEYWSAIAPPDGCTLANARLVCGNQLAVPQRSG